MSGYGTLTGDSRSQEPGARSEHGARKIGFMSAKRARWLAKHPDQLELRIKRVSGRIVRRNAHGKESPKMHEVLQWLKGIRSEAFGMAPDFFWQELEESIYMSSPEGSLSWQLDRMADRVTDDLTGEGSSYGALHLGQNDYQMGIFQQYNREALDTAHEAIRPSALPAIPLPHLQVPIIPGAFGAADPVASCPVVTYGDVGDELEYEEESLFSGTSFDDLDDFGHDFDDDFDDDFGQLQQVHSAIAAGVDTGTVVLGELDPEPGLTSFALEGVSEGVADFLSEMF